LLLEIYFLTWYFVPKTKIKSIVEKKNFETMIKYQITMDRSNHFQLQAQNEHRNSYQTSQSTTKSSNSLTCQRPRDIIEKRLKENYPITYALIHSIVTILICLVQLILEIILIVHRAPYSKIGSGIWAGIYGIILASVLLYSSIDFCFLFIFLIYFSNKLKR